MLFEYDPVTQKATKLAIDPENINLEGRLLSQIGDTLYAYGPVSQLLMKLNVLPDQITREVLAESPTVRCFPSMTVFGDNFLFVTGGSSGSDENITFL